MFLNSFFFISERRIFPFLCFLIFFLLPHKNQIEGKNFMAIDFGSDSLKIGLILPESKPLYQVVLNTESKRKTNSKLAFHLQQPLIGESASNLMTRFPSKVYSFLHHSLDQNFEIRTKLQKEMSPIIREDLKTIFLFNSDRNSLNTFDTELNEYLELEELLAEMLNLITKMAKDHARLSQSPTDAIIAIPPFFTSRQRKLLIDAAELANLNLKLIDEHIAISVTYALDEITNEVGPKKNILFIDMGASSTRMSIISFESDSKSIKSNVLSVQWSHYISGVELDFRLVNYFIKSVSSEIQEKIIQNPKAIEKLFREAKKTKEILSANRDTKVIIEGLLSDFDFTFSISRESFEDLCKDLFEKTQYLIESTFRMANLEIHQIDGVEIIGGISRIPKFQQILKDKLQRDLSVHINGDEGILQGAAYSLLSKLKFQIEEISPLPLLLNLISIDGLEKGYSTLELSNHFENIISVFSNSKNSLDFELVYATSNEFSTILPTIDPRISKITVKTSEENEISLEENGILEIILVIKIKDGGAIDIQAFLSSFNEEGSLHTLSLKPNTQVENFKPLKVLIHEYGTKYLSPGDKLNSKKKLSLFEQLVQRKYDLDESKNQLESYLFEIKTFKNEKDFLLYSKKQELQMANNVFEEAESLLDQNVNSIEVLNEIYIKLKQRYDPILSRIKEHQKRETFVKESLEQLAKWSDDIKQIKDAKVKTDLLESINEGRDWIQTKNNEQKKLPLSDDPSFNSSQIEIKLKQIEKKINEGLKKTNPKESQKDPPDEWVKVKIITILIAIFGILGFILYRRSNLRGGYRLGGNKNKKPHSKRK